jgi:quinol monooxygenase YgiN
MMMSGLLTRIIIVGALLLLPRVATAAGDSWPPVFGPIYDITHFDVIPLTQNGVDFEQTAYTALFEYRDASKSDPGYQSFRVVNWLLASNHSQIIDVWDSLSDFEAHLAQPHSVDFRFAVQVQPPPPPPGFNCCIGSPIDDRQYQEIASFNTPWTSSSLPIGVGAKNSAIFVVTYVDFLVDGDVFKGSAELVRYGFDTSKAQGQLSYTVLQQLDRPNRFATLEVWDNQTDYDAWQTNATQTSFVATVMPLLGSPLDHRVNILCGETYLDGTGCVPP